MNLYYNGTDITGNVDMRSAKYTDRAGTTADSIDLVFNDPEGQWSVWNPQPDKDTLRLWHEGVDSGVMSIDRPMARKGVFELGAVSIPQEARGGAFQVWEDIRFIELLKDFAERWGLKLKTYDLPDFCYQRVHHNGEPALSWLASRCMLESCILKVIDDALVVVHVPAMEAKEATAEIALNDHPGWNYESMSHLLCAGVRVVNGKIIGEFQTPDNCIGPILVENRIPALSFGEAQRFAKGIARAANARAHRLTIPIALSEQYAAGQIVNVSAWGAMLNGRWFIAECVHSFIDEKTTLALRRPLEGY